MIKAVKRVHKSKISDAPQAKLPKLFDFTNLTQDISVLQTFYDFIDNEDYDVINDYLINNDLNDFLNYFKSHHLYKPEQFSLIYKVCAEILMRIVGDLNSKHSLSGQSFAESFLNTYKHMIYLYFKNNKSSIRIIPCLKFITALILQSKDIALKVATEVDFIRANFKNLLSIRSLKDEEDVHTCVVNCYASFFVMNSKFLIQKVCNENTLVNVILKDLRYERFHNVQLIIEILHDKIIKNSNVSKTIKVKFFNPSTLRYLLAVYGWKGAAKNFDAFEKLSEIDENMTSVHSELHSLLIDICSSTRHGIAFVDNLLCQSHLGNMNKKLFYLIISDSMQDFFTHDLKRELLNSILTTCPDLISPFVEFLVSLMSARKPEFWTNIFKFITPCYKLLSCEKINGVLTEALNYNKGEKFIEICLTMCLPTKSLLELFQIDDNLRVHCDDEIRNLRNVLVDLSEKVITWINVSNLFHSQQQKLQIRSNFEDLVLEYYVKCGWDYEFKVMLKGNLFDESIFVKRSAEDEMETESDEEEEIDQEIAESVESLKNLNAGVETTEVNGDEVLKKCYEHFIKTPFTGMSLLKVISETLSIGKFTLKKKCRHRLIEMLTTNEFISEHWTQTTPDDESLRSNESKRNLLFDVIISCISDSKSLKKTFYERVHPLRLLSVYGATLSHSDQKILFLIMLQSMSGTLCTDYNFILFGNAVSEHFDFEANRSPIIRRPIITAQCFNLLDEQTLSNTNCHFPISRGCPMTDDQKLVLTAAQPNVYDPYFLLEWISQLLNIDVEKPLELEFGVDMKTLYTKHVLSFFVACQSSELRHIRFVSKLTLQHLLSVSTAIEKNTFPEKFQVEKLIYHLLHSTSDSTDCVKVSSIFTNLYIKLLKLLGSPNKKLFKPIMHILHSNSKFDMRYVPSFLHFMYSTDPDAKLRQAWLLGLLADSIKCPDDFRVLLDSKVLTHVLPFYGNCEQNTKKIILNLIKNCVLNQKISLMLYNYSQFIMWLNFTTNSKREKINHDYLKNIIEIFIESIKNCQTKKVNLDELKANFKCYLPELNL